MKQWAIFTYLLNMRSQQTMQEFICACNLSHEFELVCSIHTQTIWSLDQSGFVKRSKRSLSFRFEVRVLRMLVSNSFTLREFSPALRAI